MIDEIIEELKKQNHLNHGYKFVSSKEEAARLTHSLLIEQAMQVLAGCGCCSRFDAHSPNVKILIQALYDRMTD